MSRDVVRLLDLAPRRILAIRLDNVGDMIMLGPALRALRTALPDSSITVLCSPAGAQVTPLLPWVDDVIVHRAVWQDARGEMPLDPGRELAFAESLRWGGFDAALIFTSFSQSPFPPAYACYLAGIPFRAGQTADFGGSVLSPAVAPAPWAAHQVDRNLHLVEALGVPAAGRQLDLQLPAAAQRSAERMLAGAGVDPDGSFVVLAPGASCPARRYDPTRFGLVAGALSEDALLPVVIVGSDRDRAVEWQLLNAAGAGRRAPVSLVGRTSIPELAAVIRRSALVVANDSGPMHIADGFDRPLVVTFAGTELESQWRPRRSRAVLLRVPTPCAPCYRFECPYANACLDIAPDRVVAEALALLDETRLVQVRRQTPALVSQPSTNGELDGPADPDVARPWQLPVLPGAGPP
jgi:ADP-heptose:LPS heptosyltransferase